MNGILYFATKYGSTKNVSNWIASKIECAYTEIIQIENETSIDINSDFYILGTPIFIGKPMQVLIDFINKSKHILSKKNIFVFITSWAQSTEYKNECQLFIDLINFYLSPCTPMLTVSLPGKLYLDKVSAKDRNAMKRLLRRIDNMSKEFNSKNIVFNDQTDKFQSELFGSEINDFIKCRSNML